MRSLALCTALLAAACSAPPAPGLSAEAVRREVEERRSELEGCVEESTELELRLRIAPSGEVEDARARGAAALGPCIERVAGAWRFPEAEGATVAEVPLVFEVTPAAPEGERAGEEGEATIEENAEDEDAAGAEGEAPESAP